MKINGKTYSLNKYYYRDHNQYSLDNLRRTLESVCGVQIPMENMYKKKNVSGKPSLDSLIVNTGLDDVRMNHWGYKYRTLIYNLTNQYRGMKQLGKVVFAFREYMHWPNGYFGDNGSCWHEFNNGGPYLVKALGGVFLTLYTIKGEKRIPTFRCVVWPDGTLSTRPLFANSASYESRIVITDIARVFLNDGDYMMNFNFRNTLEDTNVLYLHDSAIILQAGSKEKLDGEKGTVTVDERNGQISVKVAIHDSDYRGPKCEKCECTIINKIFPHVCNEYHPVNNRIYKKV